MKKKVIVTPEMFHRDAIEMLENAGMEVTFTEPNNKVTEEDLSTLLNQADAYVAGSNKVTEKSLAQADHLKIIARFGVGFESLDWEYARSKGIHVTITPGTLEQSVAEMVFALLLGRVRHIPYFDRTVRMGEWSPHVMGSEIWGKTFGIIGTGRIGKEVAKRALGFEMDVIAYDPFPNVEWARNHGVRYLTLDELLSSSDFVTLHPPLTEETKGMVNADFLAKMKPTAFLINTGRGKLVDEESLYLALKNKQITGAALDVFECEPVSKDNPLLELSNCIFTSHVSSHTHEAMRRMSLVCAEEILRVMKGEDPKYPVPFK
jgi:D-3-phosphoglycerate dehydrogenase / 2-oxoglutarate reductase